MSRKSIKFTVFVLLAVLSSCSENAVPENPDTLRFRIAADELGVEVDTKDYCPASPVTTVPSSLYWAATSGETLSYSSRLLTVTNGYCDTGCWWPSVSTSYDEYLSNLPMTFNAGTGMTVSVNWDTDAVAGMATVPWKAVPTISLRHLQARVMTPVLKLASSYTVSNIKWTIRSTTGGRAATYNLTRDEWTDCVSLSETQFNDSDRKEFYLIPGKYIVSVSCTLTKGDYSDDFSASSEVTLVGGKRNNISATAVGGDAHEIIVVINLMPWETSSASVSELK